MAKTSEITISLNRIFNATDEQAVKYLMSQWLVYDVPTFDLSGSLIP